MFFLLKSAIDRLHHAFDFNIHADPFRTRAPMTIHATVNVVSLDANILHSRAPVAPPLSWPKQPDDRSSGRDRDVRRPRIAAHVNTRPARQQVKSFQR